MLVQLCVWFFVWFVILVLLYFLDFVCLFYLVCVGDLPVPIVLVWYLLVDFCGLLFFVWLLDLYWVFYCFICLCVCVLYWVWCVLGVCCLGFCWFGFLLWLGWVAGILFCLCCLFVCCFVVFFFAWLCFA